MINLHSRPVFGYEYDTCNAADRRIVDMKMRNPALSDHTLDQNARVAYIISNIFKVLGAFVPVVGAARIAYAVLQNDEQIGKEVLRGLAELLGAGLLMIALDVAVTCYREFEAHQSRNSQYVQVSF